MGLALAAGLWGGVHFAPLLGRVLLAAAAPVVLACATPLDALEPRAILAGLALAALSASPLLLELGPGAPTRRAAALVGASLLLATLFFVSPPGAVLASSDLGAGSLPLVLGAGLLAAIAFKRRTGA